MGREKSSEEKPEECRWVGLGWLRLRFWQHNRTPVVLIDQGPSRLVEPLSHFTQAGRSINFRRQSSNPACLLPKQALDKPPASISKFSLILLLPPPQPTATPTTLYTMDYPYFTAAQQPYTFLGLPPTPAHTGSSNSDDFSNSPPVRDHFHTLQSYSQSFLTPKQDAFEFQPFDAFNQHYNPNPIQVKAPTPHSQHKPSISTSTHNYEIPGEQNDDSNRRGSNSDDDDNMTPAQSRRKAQNRAA